MKMNYESYDILKSLTINELKELKYILQNNDKEIIIERINHIMDQQEENINKKISIDILNIDYDIIQKLKINGIKTLEDFQKIKLEEYAVRGTPTWEQLEWAKSFYDYNLLKSLPSNLTEMQQAKIFVK